MPQQITVADAIAAEMRARGVARMFGIPGGGSSLDLIHAADRVGIPFVLTQTETAATIMAAVTGELTGAPGVALAGIGPGAAAAVNGVAYAWLEQSPLALFTDCKHAPGSLHQAYDQAALYAPITKAARRLTPTTDIGATFDLTVAAPRGPVHLDLSSLDAAALTDASEAAPTPHVIAAPDQAKIAAARKMIAASNHPLIIAGLEARYQGASAALSQLAKALGAAVMTTYKAKGVFPETDPASLGAFTGAVGEAGPLVGADLIILYGVDPVELIPAPWSHNAPVIEISEAAYNPPAEPTVTLVGPLASTAQAIADGGEGWSEADLGAAAKAMNDLLALSGSGNTAETVTEAIAAAAPMGTRLTVDSGAHMLSAMARWRADAPFGVLKSNGLSTMGFALPAAIASSLHEPSRPVAAITGDGGLAMCLPELATAAREGSQIVVVVINDAALSLIDIKQQRQQRPARGVRYPPIDFAAAARSMGCGGLQVGLDENPAEALAEAFSRGGPVVVDIACDPSGYGDQLASLRG